MSVVLSGVPRVGQGRGWRKVSREVEVEILRLNRTRRMASSQIAEAVGVSKGTVHRALHRNGVVAFRSKPPTYTEEEEAEVLRRYVRLGEGSEKIGADMGMSQNTVVAIVREHGYKVRSRGGARPKLTAEDCEPIHRMYVHEGLLSIEIAERTGLHRSAVERRLAVAGVVWRTRSESQRLSRDRGRANDNLVRFNRSGRGAWPERSR